MVHHECLLVSQISREARAKMVKIRLASLRITYIQKRKPAQAGNMTVRLLGIPASLMVFVLAASAKSQSVKQFKVGTGHIGGT